MLRCKALSKCGETRRALKVVKQCLKLNPRNTKAFYQQGLLHQQVGEYDEAQASFDKMNAVLQPDNNDGGEDKTADTSAD